MAALERRQAVVLREGLHTTITNLNRQLACHSDTAARPEPLIAG